MDRIPDTGVDRADVLALLDEFAVGDIDWHSGKSWSLVYHAGDDHKEFLAEAHAKFASANLLNPMAFQSLKRMESDVIRMTASMLNGPAEAVGNVTSGGTESILLAVHAARERARRKNWLARSPEIVAPATIHPAFDKAAHYFGLKLRRVKLGADFRVNVGAMRRAITRNTILIAASAPQYAHGVVDPIAEIGAIAQRRKIPFHVDACFGGFVLPWLEELGHPVPVFDFRVPGVTSMSADLHKYGYASKGASVVLYRSMDYLRHQFFVATDSPLGIYASPTILGTRPGGPIAGAWATLVSLGRTGYLDLATRTLAATNALRAGIEAIDGIEVLGSTDGSIVTWAATEPGLSTYAIGDQLATRGWGVDRQQKPASIHCTVTANHVDAVAPYLADLADAVEFVRAHPELASQGEAAMYGMMSKVPIRGAVRAGVVKVLEGMHAHDANTSTGASPIDELIGRVESARDFARSAFNRLRGQ